MKQAERIILSILRRPIKTIIVICLVFVMANIISGSLILYNSTQKLKDNIQSNVLPSVIFDTTQDVVDLFEKEEWEFKKDEVNLLDHILDEISQFNEVEYENHLLINPTLYTENIVYYSDVVPTEYLKVWSSEHSDAFIGINKVNNLLFENKIIEIVEGNNFSEKNLNNDIYKIILLNDAKVIDNYGNKHELEIGETVTIVTRILDEEKLVNEFNKYVFSYNGNSLELKDILDNKINKKYNNWIESITLYKKEYKCEIIGFFEEYDKEIYNNGISNIGYEYDYYNLIPEKLLLEIHNDYNEAYRALNLTNNTTAKNQLLIFKNFVKIVNNESIDGFVNKCKDIFAENDLDVKINLNNDLYLKIAGPLDGINTLSRLLLFVGIGVSVIMLTCLSIIFIKERRKEIGMLLSMGEGKKNIIKQLILEMSIVCLIGISTSLFTSNMFAGYISDTLINNSDYKVELSEEEKLMIDEEYSTIKVMNEYEKILESNNVLIVSGISLGICLLSTSVSALYVLKMNPKEILM